MLPAPLLRRARPRHRAPARPPARRLWQPPEACRGDGAKAVRTTVERSRGCCAPRARQDRVPKAPGARARSKRSPGPQEPPRRALARLDREPQAPGADSCTNFSPVASCSLAEGTRQVRRPGQPPGESARSSADALREPHKLRRGPRDLLVGLGPARALIRDLLVGPGARRSDVQGPADQLIPTPCTFSLLHLLRTSLQVPTK